MMQICGVGLTTGNSYTHADLLYDDDAYQLIEYMNKNYKHSYYWGIRVFKAIMEG